VYGVSVVPQTITIGSKLIKVHSLTSYYYRVKIRITTMFY
jgi:hypothetical protein